MAGDIDKPTGEAHVARERGEERASHAGHERITLVLPEETAEKFRDSAKQNGRTLSAHAERLLRFALDHFGGDPIP